MPWRARDFVDHPLRRRGGRPQLKRDPLGGIARPMEDQLSEIRSAIAQYLDGNTSFEAAASRVATIIRGSVPLEPREAPVEPRRLRLQALSLREWLDPKVSRGPTITAQALELAPGRAPAEEGRAREVFTAALRLLKPSGPGDAA